MKRQTMTIPSAAKTRTRTLRTKWKRGNPQDRPEHISPEVTAAGLVAMNSSQGLKYACEKDCNAKLEETVGILDMGMLSRPFARYRLRACRPRRPYLPSINEPDVLVDETRSSKQWNLMNLTAWPHSAPEVRVVE